VDQRRGALEGVVRAHRPVLVGGGAQRLREGPWRVVVTGAGGWLGLATLELLAGLFGSRFSERVVCYGARERTLNLRGGLQIAQSPLDSLGDLPPAPSLVLHLAFITQGPAMTLDAAGYVAANRALAAHMRACLDRIGAEAVFQASSGAAYLADPAGGPQSKALYGWLKVEDEESFSAWAERRCARAAIGRIFNLSGPYINRRSTYALASFVTDALSGRPVRVGAPRPVLRSYVAIEMLMSVVLGVLTEGAPGAVRFETAGEVVVEVGELAQAVAAALGAPGVDRPNYDPDASADRYVGDGSAFDDLARLYGAAPIDLATQIRQTADFIAEFPETL
jgi:nucleoside-diphosphate-sugar epimerase